MSYILLLILIAFAISILAVPLGIVKLLIAIGITAIIVISIIGFAHLNRENT